MKAVTLGALMCAAALIAACFVDRPSEAFQCTTTADCASLGGNRQCMDNYCVVVNCPSDCSSCDIAAKTCTAECTTADRCGSVDCPAGWTCTINCTGSNACNNVTCPAGSTCAIACTGANACDNVSCEDACKCDLTCAAGACNTPTCPAVGNGANRVECTSDGTATGNCDSAHAPGCAKC